MWYLSNKGACDGNKIHNKRQPTYQYTIIKDIAKVKTNVVDW